MTPALPAPPPQPDAGTPGALLPCPWCGSRMVVADGRLSGTHETTWTYAVVCRCCEASGPPAESQDSDLARGDAESAWQSRAPAPPGPAATAGVWIACGERMPPLDKSWVLVYADGAMNCMLWTPNGWDPVIGWRSLCNVPMDGITHWMPLPPPPGTVKAEAGQGVSRLAALENVAAEARKLAHAIPATSWHLHELNEALKKLDAQVSQ